MGAFCNLFDKICTEMGASAIYCHHHSKGTQGWKKAMDRASGSGVFSRDPDAILDIIELKRPLVRQTEVDGDGGETVIIEEDFDPPRTAWRMEASLAGIPAHPPHQLFLRLPAAHAGLEGELSGYMADGSPLSNLALSSRRTTPEIRRQRLDDAFRAAPKGEPVTVRKLAELAEVSYETMRRYVREFSQDYVVANGVVQERALLSDTISPNMQKGTHT